MQGYSEVITRPKPLYLGLCLIAPINGYYDPFIVTSGDFLHSNSPFLTLKKTGVNEAKPRQEHLLKGLFFQEGKIIMRKETTFTEYLCKPIDTCAFRRSYMLTFYIFAFDLFYNL